MTDFHHDRQHAHLTHPIDATETALSQLASAAAILTRSAPSPTQAVRLKALVGKILEQIGEER